MKGLKILLAVVLFLGLVALVPAQMAVEKDVPAMEQDNDPSIPLPRMGEALGLSDEQRAKMMDMMLALQRAVLPLKSKLHELKVQLKLKITADDYSEKTVDQLLNQIVDLEKQIQKKRIAHMRAVRDMLTPDQRKKFDAAILSGKGLKPRMHDRFHRMPVQRRRPMH